MRYLNLQRDIEIGGTYTGEPTVPSLGKFFMDRLGKEYTNFANLYRELLNLYGNEEEITGLLKEPYGNYFKYPEGWYAMFHKMLRQVDVYGNDVNYVKVRYIKSKSKMGRTVQNPDWNNAESICGKLDSIFYNVIGADNEFLYDFMRNTFEDYKHELNKQAKFKAK